MEKKIMVAIDETEASFDALMWALDNLSDKIESAKLIVFAAQPIPNCQYSSVFASQLGYAQLYCPVSATAELMLLAHEQNRKVYLGLLEKARIICGRRGIKIEAVTEAGNPKETICRAVQKHKIDLLVLGDQDRGIFKRIFQGDLTNYCIKNAKCSVLVVKKGS